jgi:hypothetical protein
MGFIWEGSFWWLQSSLSYLKTTSALRASVSQPHRAISRSRKEKGAASGEPDPVTRAIQSIYDYPGGSFDDDREIYFSVSSTSRQTIASV